mgnify:CR=1 FL=1
MSQKEKLIKRLKARPKDFTFDEAEALLLYLSYRRLNKGKTSGPRMMFVSELFSPIMLHRPHPENYLKAYQIKQLIDKLEQECLI